MHRLLLFAICLSATTAPCLALLTTVCGREVRRTPLVPSDESSPYAFSIASILDINSSTDNFLATQVWPSAREASRALLERSEPTWKICEFGCGPGLPSIVAATTGCPLVIATDLDELGLELVDAAAKEQRLKNLETRRIDLSLDPKSIQEENDSWFQEIDLFVMADIFENAEVAEGAAALTKAILKRKTNLQQDVEKQPRVWVFAQSDRAQREIYLQSMQEAFPEVHWSSLGEYKDTDRLWLVDLDETTVKYG